MTSHERARTIEEHGIACRVIPWVVLAVVLGLQALGTLLVWRHWDQHAPLGYQAGLPVIFGSFGFALVSTIVGLLIVQRLHRNLAGWLLVGYGVGTTLAILATIVASIGIPRGIEPVSSLVAWAASSTLQAASGAQIAALMLVYPDGRLPSRRWRPVVVLVIVSTVVRSLETAFKGDHIYYFPTTPTPASLDGPVGALLEVSSTLDLGLWGLFAAILLAAASQVVRYRAAGAIERLQIRWFAVSSAILALAILNLVRIFATSDPAVTDAQVDWLAFIVAATLHPVAIGLAITRYRLYAFDRILNKALVYGALTAILAGVFAASVSVSQKILIAVTGESSDAVLVVTTLVVTTLYTPVRKRLESMAERHLRFRSARFGGYAEALHQTLDLLDPDEVADRLLDEAMRALDAPAGRVDLWLGDGASTGRRVPRPSGGLTISIDGASGSVGRLWLADRRGGEAYRPDEIAAVTEVACLAGRAVELVVRTARASMTPTGVRSAERSSRPGGPRRGRRTRQVGRPSVATTPVGGVAVEPI